MSQVKRWLDNLMDAAMAGDEEARRTLREAGVAGAELTAEGEGWDEFPPEYYRDTYPMVQQ